MQNLSAILVVVWVTITLTFFVLRILPGDAVSAQLAQIGASPSEIDERISQMGLDDPVLIQYMRYMSGLLRGDWGYSLVTQQPVTQMIFERLLPTFTLALGSILIATLTGTALGILAAQQTPIGQVAQWLMVLSFSTPIYWTGTLAIIFFAVELDWLPSSGTGNLSHLVLPVGILSFHTMGEIARVTQANLREVQGAAFIQMARAKGLPEGYILRRHVLRISLIPVITVIALQTGFLLSGTVITESLFVRPGIGRLLLDSAIRQDYPVVQGVVILSALIYTLLNILANTAVQVVDPRLRV